MLIETIAYVSAPVATALGAYNIGRYAVEKGRAVRQRVKERRADRARAVAVDQKLETVLSYVSAVKDRVDAASPESKAAVKARLETLLKEVTAPVTTVIEK